MTCLRSAVLLLALVTGPLPAGAQTCPELTAVIRSATDRFREHVRDDRFDALITDYQIGIVMSGAQACTVENDRNTLECDWSPLTEAGAERRSEAAVAMIRACLPPQTRTRTFVHQRTVGHTTTFYETRENMEVSSSVYQFRPRSGAPGYWGTAVRVARQ